MKNTLPMLCICLLLAFSFSAGTVAAGSVDRGGKQAVSLWWIIFNNPDACLTNPGAVEQCGEVDVFGAAYVASLDAGEPNPILIAPNLEAELGVIYATGGVTESNGKIRLAASIYRSAADVALDLSSGPNVVDPLGLQRAFENPLAEVHGVVRTHGPAAPGGDDIIQITNFLEGFCSDLTLGFEAGPRTCADVQFAIFAPGESGADDVFEFGSPPEQVNGATAYLFRNGDMLQMIVETRVRRDNE